MPAYVAGLFERSDRRDVLDSPLDELASKIPVISSKDIAANPGRLFEALFAMIESHHRGFKECIALISRSCSSSDRVRAICHSNNLMVTSSATHAPHCGQGLSLIRSE